LHKKIINKHKLKFTILPKRVAKCMLCQVRYVTIVLYGLMKFIGSSDGPPGGVLALWTSRKLVCDVPQFRCGHVEGGPACCSPI